eukprot:scaffold5376_cov171-Amphora_coffeaeformis.AAC.1
MIRWIGTDFKILRTKLPSLGEIVEDTPSLSTLEVALETAGLLDAFFCEIEDVTVFAPTNAAFEALGMESVNLLLTPGWTLHLQTTLLKHVVDGVIPSSAVTDGAVVTTLSGEPITVSRNGDICFAPVNVCVEMADVMAQNGIAHVVDQVIIPDWAETTFADVVTNSDNFSILADLLSCASLTSLPDEITVFAPTNDAFNALFAETVETLTDILKYHVITAVVPSVLIDGGVNYALTLQGSMVTITNCLPDSLTIDESSIVATDVLTNGGIIHVIDAVLTPPVEPMSKSGKSSSKVCGTGKSSKSRRRTLRKPHM